MSIADDIRAAAFSRDPSPIEDVLCTVLMTDAELSMTAWPGEQYRTFMLIVAESFDDRERRERMETARAHAAREAQQWAVEARAQRSTVLEILRYFDLPEHDWEALRLIRAKVAADTATSAPTVSAKPPASNGPNEHDPKGFDSEAMRVLKELVEANEVQRELMQSCEAAAEDATMEGFAQSQFAERVDRFARTVYRMGFESGWRIREQQSPDAWTEARKLVAGAGRE